MDLTKIENIVVDDVHLFDHPDYCDAFIATADWSDTGKPLTDDELEELNTNHSDFVHEAVFDSQH